MQGVGGSTPLPPTKSGVSQNTLLSELGTLIHVETMKTGSLNILQLYNFALFDYELFDNLNVSKLTQGRFCFWLIFSRFKQVFSVESVVVGNAYSDIFISGFIMSSRRISPSRDEILFSQKITMV